MENEVEKKEFKCNKCGCCCKNVSFYEPASFLDRGDGTCKYFNDETRLCNIYEFRPEFCRVDKMYKLYKDNMTWDEYLDLNYESCEYLREKEEYKEKPTDISSNTVKENNDLDKSIVKKELETTINDKIIINNEEVDDYLFDDDEDFFGGV